jgi:hypothetical protein
MRWDGFEIKNDNNSEKKKHQLRRKRQQTSGADLTGSCTANV